MIRPDERKYLTDKLTDLLAPLMNPRHTLCIAIDDPRFAADLPLNDSPSILVANGVRLCLEDGWRHRPSWLERLVTSPPLAGMLPMDATLEVIRQAAARVPPEADIDALLGTTLLNRATPFINRRLLRQKLQTLEKDASRQQPILVVSGTGRVGKSYTMRYVEHFAFSQPGEPRIRCYHVAFKPDMALGLGAEEIATELVFSIGRSRVDKPDRVTNDKLYARQLALWVLNEAVQAGLRHWFVFDGFRAVAQALADEQPRQDALDFIVEMSSLVTGGAFVERCRLILPGFDRSLLTVEPGKVMEERVQACTTKDAQQCLAEVLGTAPLALSAECRTAIEGLLLQDLPTGDVRMAELNGRLRCLVDALAALEETQAAGAPAAEVGELLVDLLSGLPSGPQRGPELARRLEALRVAAVET